MENSASNNNEVSLHPQLDKVRISTMPEEFFSHAPAPKVSILVLSLVLLVLVCAGLLSWILIKQNMNPATQPIVVVNVNSASPDTNTPPTNTKINSNAPVNTPAVIPPPAPAVTAPLGGALVINQSTQDSDQDKLTDVEEELFGTDPKKPDSDGDNHTDGSELVNLFDPAKASPAKLDDSAFIRTVSVDPWGYSIFYPAKWVARPIDSDQKEYMFTSALGEFIEVLVQDNSTKLSLTEWYGRQSPGGATMETFNTKRGMRGIRSPDHLTVYMVPEGSDQGTVIYTLSYNAGTATVYNFLTTFEMMVNSFKVNKVISGAPAPVSAPAPASSSSSSTPPTVPPPASASPAPSSTAPAPATQPSSGSTTNTTTNTSASVTGPTAPPPGPSPTGLPGSGPSNPPPANPNPNAGG